MAIVTGSGTGIGLETSLLLAEQGFRVYATVRDGGQREELLAATEKNLEKMKKFVENFAEKSGSYLHPQREITDFLVIGLAKNIDEVGRPLCPCMFFEDKQEEIRKKEWICPCEEMQKWKYCH